MGSVCVFHLILCSQVVAISHQTAESILFIHSLIFLVHSSFYRHLGRFLKVAINKHCCNIHKCANTSGVYELCIEFLGMYSNVMWMLHTIFYVLGISALFL